MSEEYWSDWSAADYVEWVIGDKRPQQWRGNRGFMRVLSIDGGGIRGVVPAVALKQMEERAGKPISELFDIICGTSTGGLLALGLTYPQEGSGWTTFPQPPKYSAEFLLDIYRTRGPEIFRTSRRQKLRSLGGFLSPSYRATGIEKLTEEVFGDTRLKDAIRHTLITSYDSQQRRPFPFNSSTNQSDTSWQRGRGYELRMRDVARATSAAPTFFPPHKIMIGAKKFFSALDGGVAANNPAQYGMMEAQARVGDCSMLIVSLGTGEKPEQFAYDAIRGWGKAQWIKPVIDLLGSATSETTHQLLNFFINGILPEFDTDHRQTRIQAKKKRFDANSSSQFSTGAQRGRWTRYLRYQPTLHEAAATMDDVSTKNVRALEADATRFLDAKRDDFNLLCDFLSLAAEKRAVSYPDWGPGTDPRFDLVPEWPDVDPRVPKRNSFGVNEPVP